MPIILSGNAQRRKELLMVYQLGRQDGFRRASEVIDQLGAVVNEQRDAMRKMKSEFENDCLRLAGVFDGDCARMQAEFNAKLDSLAADLEVWKRQLLAQAGEVPPSPVLH